MVYGALGAMKRPQVRPKILLEIPSPPEEVLRRIRAALSENPSRFRGTVLGSSVELTVSREQQRFWSPQMSLQVEPHPGGTLLRGRVGPRPPVWTALVAIYAVVGFSSFFSLFFAMSHLMLSRPLWPFWALPVGLGVAGLVYLVAHVGQRLGADQTDSLGSFFTGALDLPQGTLQSEITPQPEDALQPAKVRASHGTRDFRSTRGMTD